MPKKRKTKFEVIYLTCSFELANGVSRSHSFFVSYLRKKGIPVHLFVPGSRNSCNLNVLGSDNTYEVVKPMKLGGMINAVETPIESNGPNLIKILNRIYDIAKKIKKKKNTIPIIYVVVPDPVGSLGLFLSKFMNLPSIVEFNADLMIYSNLRNMERWNMRTGKFISIAIKVFMRFLSLHPERSEKIGKIAGKTFDAVGRILSRFISDLSLLGARAIYNLADVVTTPTVFFKNKISKSLNPPVRVVSSSVDTAIFNPKYRTIRKQRKKPQILFVSRIAVEKNLDYVVESYKILKDKALFKVVGDGPELENMKKRMPEAEFTGKLSGKELSKAYANGDIFGFPSYSETLGMVVLEAMASGLPVVGMSGTSVGKLISKNSDAEKRGISADNVEDYISSLRILADDAEKRRAMSANALKFARMWPKWEFWGDKLIETLQYSIKRHYDRKYLRRLLEELI